MKPKYVTLLMLLLIAAAAVGVKLWQDKQNEKALVYQPKSKQEQTNEPQSLGAQVYVQTQNPVAGQVPSNNPFDDQNNPITDSYTNPF